jgi:orotate phosphoribosyltransferase-like protein
MKKLVKSRKLPQWKGIAPPAVQGLYPVTQELINEKLFEKVEEVQLGLGEAERTKKLRTFQPTDDARRIYRWFNGSAELSPEIVAMSIWQPAWEATVGRLEEKDEVFSKLDAQLLDYKQSIDVLVPANVSGWGLANFLSERLQKPVYPVVLTLIDHYELGKSQLPSLKDKGVALVDYCIISGNTIRRAKEAVVKLGGKTVVGIVVLYYPEILKEKIGLPVVCMHQVGRLHLGREI